MMRTSTMLWIGGGLAAAAAIFFAARSSAAPKVSTSDPLVGKLVRVPIAAAHQESFPTNADGSQFLLAGLLGAMVVRVTGVHVPGDAVEGVVVSFDSFDTVRGFPLPTGGIGVTFARGAIQS